MWRYFHLLLTGRNKIEVAIEHGNLDIDVTYVREKWWNKYNDLKYEDYKYQKIVLANDIFPFNSLIEI